LTQGIQNITSVKNRAFWRLLACKFAGLKNSVIVPRPVLAFESCISPGHLLTEKTPACNPPLVGYPAQKWI